jgi:iron(III) transport system substrate-binding protein
VPFGKEHYLVLNRPLVSRRSVVLGGGLAAVSGLVLHGRALATTESVEDDGTPESAEGGTPVGTNGEVVIYSGRNENLVGALIAEFQRDTGIKAEVRYGDTAELAATILDEGDNSPADLFFSQDAGALGALAVEGRLQTLPDDLLNRVDPRFRSDDGLWVGASGRARVAVYNTDQLKPEDLPESVTGLTDPKWKGKLGWAPTNGSFQAFITAFRVLEGDDAVREWLQGMLANEPAVFDSNGPLTLAVGEGELALGLVNHYYLYEVQAEEGKTFPLANHFFSAGDPGSLVNVAGVGALTTAKHQTQALAFADFLLDEAAQEYFAEKTFEYPLIAGVEPAPGLIPLADIQSPEIDLSDLSDLQGTLALLTEAGVV